MIGITFASLAATHARLATAHAERTARLDTVAKEAQDRVKEDSDEWELAAGEGGDGGSAVRLPRRDPEWEALGPIPAKSKKVVAKEKAVRERKRAEQGAASRLLALNESGLTHGNALGGKKPNGKQQNGKVFPSRNSNQNESIPNNKLNTGTLGDTNGKQRAKQDPAEKQELPSQFTERLAFLDMDDDEEGGVSLVYK